MLPARGDLSWRSLRDGVGDHLRLKRPVDDGSYNLVQRLSYLCVVFVLFPLTILTGFAMSPAITSVVPSLVTVLGLCLFCGGSVVDWGVCVHDGKAKGATGPEAV
jgi:thiosulfate reductase cytochrome b subunit